MTLASKLSLLPDVRTPPSCVATLRYDEEDIAVCIVAIVAYSEDTSCEDGCVVVGVVFHTAVAHRPPFLGGCRFSK